jgi:hypothetical protein
VRGAAQREGNSQCRADSSADGASPWPRNDDANSSVGEDPARLSHLPTRTTTTSELDDGMEARAASLLPRDIGEHGH